MRDEYRRDFSLHDYFHVIGKRFLTVVATVVIVVGLVALFNWRQVPTFVTSGKVMIERPKAVTASLNIMQSMMLTMNNYIEMIKSNSFLEKVAIKLREQGQDRVSVASIQGNLNIKPVSGTDLLEVVCYGSEPESLKRIVDAVIDIFVSDSETLQARAVEETTEYLKKQLDILEEQLRMAERELRDFQQSEKIFSLPKEMEQFHADIVKWQTEKKELEMSLLLEEKNAETMHREMKGLSISTLPGNIADVEEEFGSIEKELKQALKVYREKHPKVQELRKRLAMMEGAVTGQGAAAVDPAYAEFRRQLFQRQMQIHDKRIRVKALEELIKERVQDFDQVPEKNLTYLRLERRVKVTESVYTIVLQKYNESQIQEASIKPRAQVVDYAYLPKKPIRPNKVLNLLIALLAAIVTGIGFAFLREHLDKSIKTSEEAKIILERPVVGLIPEFRSSELKESKRLMEKAKVFLSPTLLTFTEMNTLSSESFRTLRTNIQYAQSDRTIKSILIADPQEAAGKSTIAANIAISFAQVDKRVLLVDTDLRKPILHKMFNQDNSLGLTNVLLGGKLEDAISRTAVRNLDLLTSGPVPPNPSELLGTHRMDEVIKILESNYDLIVFDSPPVIAVTDAAVLASRVDGILYMVSIHRVARKQAEKGLELLLNVNANVFGIICNYVKDRELGGYYYRYGYV